jgi:dCMP deaminase
LIAYTKWDAYYLRLCRAVASNSSCLSRKIGAILVQDKSIISTGYNGPPRGIPRCDKRWGVDTCLPEMPKCEEQEGIDTCSPVIPECEKDDDGRCPRRVLNYPSGKGLEICIAGHAERNALINAARNGICTKGTIMYMDCPISCKDCLIEIINAGVEEIVVTTLDYYDPASKYLVEHSGIKVRTFTGETL